MPHFGQRSLENLRTLHPDLQKILNMAIKIYDFSIIDGLRGEEKQIVAVETGKSEATYPNSKHNRSKKDDGTYDYNISDAVDIVPYPVKWPDVHKQSTKEYTKRMGEFYRLAGIINAIAFTLGIKIKWGGDFKTFFDGPHFERVV